MSLQTNHLATPWKPLICKHHGQTPLKLLKSSYFFPYFCTTTDAEITHFTHNSHIVLIHKSPCGLVTTTTDDKHIMQHLRRKLSLLLLPFLHYVNQLDVTHLFLILPARGVQRLDQRCGVADKHGVAGRTHDHAEDGQPHVCHADRRVHAISNTQHVAHGLEESVRILLTPCVVLKGERDGTRDHHKQLMSPGEMNYTSGSQPFFAALWSKCKSHGPHACHLHITSSIQIYNIIYSLNIMKSKRLHSLK